TVEAKLAQAQAMRNAAAAQNQKANAGTRSQTKQAAYDLWQQAIAKRDITKKTFDRMQSLFEQDVISAQKRDEAEAAYKASVAAENAAKSQYDLATEGAQREDKASAAAMVSAAAGTVKEVKSILEDEYLVAPCDGRIDVIYPNEGELVATGSPIMSLLKDEDKWVTFNVNESLLNSLAIGQEITVIVPALDSKEVKAKIYYIRDMGDYASWRATKATGEWDSRTFQIKARPVAQESRLLPGMTILYKKTEK
ncbi:MAG: HlyD family efflux transporter periplasmic adaptor subunit, partial [Muribaculaceae bacterium]|nr:HlyD family efflux transporter periplasmic adaptor subunit [Muribaculaceae bacterium]